MQRAYVAQAQPNPATKRIVRERESGTHDPANSGQMQENSYMKGTFSKTAEPPSNVKLYKLPASL